MHFIVSWFSFQCERERERVREKKGEKYLEADWRRASDDGGTAETVRPF